MRVSAQDSAARRYYCNEDVGDWPLAMIVQARRGEGVYSFFLGGAGLEEV